MIFIIIKHSLNVITLYHELIFGIMTYIKGNNIFHCNKVECIFPVFILCLALKTDYFFFYNQGNICLLITENFYIQILKFRKKRIFYVFIIHILFTSF